MAGPDAVVVAAPRTGLERITGAGVFSAEALTLEVLACEFGLDVEASEVEFSETSTSSSSSFTLTGAFRLEERTTGARNLDLGRSTLDVEFGFEVGVLRPVPAPDEPAAADFFAAADAAGVAAVFERPRLGCGSGSSSSSTSMTVSGSGSAAALRPRRDVVDG